MTDRGYKCLGSEDGDMLGTAEPPTGRIVRETRHTELWKRERDPDNRGAREAVVTKRCALCETPREEFKYGNLAGHLFHECPAGGGGDG